MKNKNWTKTAFYIIIFGWFIFMFLCAWGMWLEVEYRLVLVLLGLCACMVGSFMMLSILQDDDLFKSIDELEEERYKYYQATERLNKKIKEL